MPVVHDTSYRPPAHLRMGHVNTLVGGKLRRVPRPAYHRERITTDDDDFLDLDWLRGGHDRLAIVSHGLEGSTDRCYLRGMVRALSSRGWDVLAWNFRSCSGEPNRHPHSYHSGATHDLQAVVDHAGPGYGEMALIGFSLGGNLTLKYAGERSLDGRIQRVAALSAPCDLRASSMQLSRLQNRGYMAYFMRSLHAKVRQKHALFPDAVAVDGLDAIRTFQEFDDRYTAPLHGFRDAEDYWNQCSSARFLEGITVPTLILNAADDPFLAGDCYPEAVCDRLDRVTLEIPRYGGHVGFASPGETYWSEARVLRFLEDA